MDELMESAKVLKAWTVRVSAGQAKAFVDDLLKSEQSSKTNILAVRADMIFGADHIRTALYHAKRAHADGRNSANSIPMETLLYASGERQLGAAIDKMSVTDGTEEVVVVSLDGSLISSVDPRSWTSLPDTDDETSVADLVSFGISRTELDTLQGRRFSELVMEKVAAVDILKK